MEISVGESQLLFELVWNNIWWASMIGQIFWNVIAHFTCRKGLSQTGQHAEVYWGSKEQLQQQGKWEGKVNKRIVWKEKGEQEEGMNFALIDVVSQKWFISLLFVNCASFSRQLILSFEPYLCQMSGVNVYYFSTLSHSLYTYALSAGCLWQATVRFRLNSVFFVDAKRQISLITVILRLRYFPLQAQWQVLQHFLQWFLWLIEAINHGTLLNFTIHSNATLPNPSSPRNRL